MIALRRPALAPAFDGAPPWGSPGALGHVRHVRDVRRVARHHRSGEAGPLRFSVLHAGGELNEHAETRPPTAAATPF